MKYFSCYTDFKLLCVTESQQNDNIQNVCLCLKYKQFNLNSLSGFNLKYKVHGP